MKSLRGLLVPILFLALAAALPPLAAATREPVHTIDLTDANDIADYESVAQALNHLSEKVQECYQAHPPPSSCPCQFPKELGALRAAYNAAVGKHPNWADKGSVVSYYDRARGQSDITNFSALKRQIDACGKP
jgi:hypothetical protein